MAPTNAKTPDPAGAQADQRRSVPRTDVLLADPRLRDAARRLGPAAVKARCWRPSRAPGPARSAPMRWRMPRYKACPARAATLDRWSTPPASCCTPTSGGRRCPPPRSTRVARRRYLRDVEFDLATGQRARRGRGALAALAAAVPGRRRRCSSSTTAPPRSCSPPPRWRAGREIVVSRGEMVEIGDGFRLPELIASTGARLREVGTTNRTSPRDYAEAVGPDTGCILKVHPSQLPRRGLHLAPSPVAELAGLGRPWSSSTSAAGCCARDPLLPDEPDATTALRAGAAVVTCSGDKLLGGPQAGLLLGDAEVVEPPAPPPAGPRAARRQAHPRRARGDPRGPRHADAPFPARRPGRRCAACRAPGRAWRVGVDAVASDGRGRRRRCARTAPARLGRRPARPRTPALRRGDPRVVGRVERGRCLLDLRCVEPRRRRRSRRRGARGRGPP